MVRILQISTILKLPFENGREHRRRYSQERAFQDSPEGRSSRGKREESTNSVGSGCPEHLEGESAEVRKPERQERQPTGLGLQLFRDEEHVDPGSSAAWDKVAPAARP